MAFPNNITDIVATTIENRSRKIQDNVTDNNAALKKMSMRGNMKTFSGGSKIVQEISFAENANAGWYSGYDILPTNQADVITYAEFPIKQAACPVIMSGLEQLQNAGKEQMIDLMEGRISVAESSMANLIAAGIYSNGTAASGKQIDGFDAAIPLDPTVGTYGGIPRNLWTFWRSQLRNVANTSAILTDMNALWASTVRGMDRVDLILVDNVIWSAYMVALQAQQRFTDPKVGELGFPAIKFMDADVILDGGIGGACPTGTGFFLNTKYIYYRPHASRNMVPLSPNRRYATNQDAEVQILGFAGNVTSSGPQFCGRYDVNP
jgi:hypothetical protein